MSSSPSPPQPVDPWAQAAAQYGLSTGTADFNARLNRTNQVNPLGSTGWTITGYDAGPSAAPGSTAIPGYDPSSGFRLGAGGSITPGLPAGTGGSGQPAANPYNPYGSYGGNPNGSFGLGGAGGGMITPPGGQTVQIPSGGGGPQGTGAPIYTQSTQLAPQFQSVLDKPIDTSGIAGMPGGPSTTEDLANTRDSLYQQQMSFLKPEQDLQSEQLTSQLANEGATIGSPAWNNEQERLARQQELAQSNVRSQAIQAGGAEQSRLFGLGSQSLQDQIAARNAPISEFQSLLGPQGGAASALTPDISGAFGQQYQGALAGYNANVASDNNTTSTLGSLALAAAMFFSDRRLKEDIKQVGKTNEGLPVYTYRFKGDPRVQMGVMAQDVEKSNPEAVFSLGGRDGPKMVNYGAIR